MEATQLYGTIREPGSSNSVDEQRKKGALSNFLNQFGGPFSAFWNITKTFAGAGSFGLPWAIKQSGIFAGIIGMLMFALLADYTMLLLVKCRRYIQSQEEYANSDYWKYRALRGKQKRRYPPNISYIHNDHEGNSEYGVNDNDDDDDVIESAINKIEKSDNVVLKNEDHEPWNYIYDQHRIFTYIDLGYESMGHFGTVLVYCLFFSCNLGVATVYLVGFGDLMASMIPITSNYDINERIWMLIMIPLFIPMSQIRNYKLMSPFSILGTVSLIIALGTVLIYGIQNRLEFLKAPWEYGSNSFVNPSTLPLFFGVTAFLFNTHTMVLPIEQSLVNRRAYPITLHFSFLFVTFMNVSFAILVFMFFGNDIQDNATKNIPNSILVYIVKGTLCAELCLTYGVVLMPVSEAIDEQLLGKFKENSKPKFIIFGSLVRVFLVLFTVGVALIFGSKFGVVMGLIGGISPNALGFILPPLFHLILMRRKMNVITWTFNCMIIIFGVLAMITCTWVASSDLIETFKQLFTTSKT